MGYTNKERLEMLTRFRSQASLTYRLAQRDVELTKQSFHVMPELIEYNITQFESALRLAINSETEIADYDKQIATICENMNDDELRNQMKRI